MDIRFNFSSYGAYNVTYTTRRGDYYIARIEDMTLIDDTKNEAEPTKAAWKRLVSAVKRNGSHFHKNGERFND